MQADVLVKTIMQTRLLKSEAQEIKLVVVQLLLPLGFPVKEVHAALDKAAVVENCCVPVPPSGARRPMQDYTHMLIYFCSEHMQKIVKVRVDNNGSVLNELLHELAEFLVNKLGLRCPSEMTTAVLCATVGVGDSQWLSYSPSVLHQLFKATKASLARLIQTASPWPEDCDYITRLPSCPTGLPANWYKHAFPQGWDCSASGTTMALVHANARKIPCRNSCKAISHPYMPQPNGTFGTRNDGAANMEGVMINFMKLLMGGQGLLQTPGGKQPGVIQMLGHNGQRAGQMGNHKLKALERTAEEENVAVEPAANGAAELPYALNGGLVAVDDGKAASHDDADDGFKEYMEQVSSLEESRHGPAKRAKRGKAKAKPKAKATAKPKAKAKAKAAATASVAIAPAPVPSAPAGANDPRMPLVRKLEGRGNYAGLPATEAERVSLWPTGCPKCRNKPGCCGACWWYRNPDRSGE